jgi:hypothetical protein
MMSQLHLKIRPVNICSLSSSGSRSIINSSSSSRAVAYLLHVTRALLHITLTRPHSFPLDPDTYCGNDAWPSTDDPLSILMNASLGHTTHKYVCADPPLWMSCIRMQDGMYFLGATVPQGQHAQLSCAICRRQQQSSIHRTSRTLRTAKYGTVRHSAHIHFFERFDPTVTHTILTSQIFLSS